MGIFSEDEARDCYHSGLREGGEVGEDDAQRPGGIQALPDMRT